MKTSSHDRRRFLAGVVKSVQGTIGGTVAVVLGRAIVPPVRAQEDTWFKAASLADLPMAEPTPVMLRVARNDGYTQVVDRQVVFLVKTSDTEVTALSSACTHLGCRVSWDAEAQALKCPCHGGTYDKTGKVIAGPPPAPLPTIRTRVDGGQVLVEV